MAIISVTGGIAVGKSVMMKYWQTQFAEPMIDTDDIGRDLLRQDVVKQSLVAILGEQILSSDGSVHRQAVQAEIFSDVQKKQHVESLLHPLIRQEVHRLAQASLKVHAYCLVVVPLLYETDTAHQYDRVCLVDSGLDQRVRRCFDRGMSETMTLAVMHSQATSEQRLSISDDILYNVKDFSFFYAQIDKLHAQYAKLYG